MTEDTTPIANESLSPVRPTIPRIRHNGWNSQVVGLPEHTTLAPAKAMSNWQLFWREFWATIRDDLSMGPVRRWLKRRKP
jgi:hypothetical protein